MNKIEREIYKILEKKGSMWYNKLKHEIVDVEQLISERPFREALTKMVKDNLVLRIPTEGQRVIYTVDFDGYKYETDGLEYFENLFKKYEQEFEIFQNTQTKFSKIEQSSILVSFLQSVYLTKLRFDEFVLFARTRKAKKVQVQLINIIDLAEATLYYSEEDDPQHDISEFSDRLLDSLSLRYLDEIHQKLMKPNNY